ncbi:MAG TPA: poly(A) polymerase [Myxococcales bacterium]|jgi:poly(A) polymerase
MGKSADKPALRPSVDVYNRIRWDARFDPARFSIGYETRDQGMQEMPFLDFVPGGEIPWHRLWYFRDESGIVWDRRTRVDRIFGSGEPEAAPSISIQPEPASPGTARTARSVPPLRFDASMGRWAPAPGLGSSPSTLTLLTYNALKEREGNARRVPALLETIRAADADLVGLQEVSHELLDALLAAEWVREAYSISESAPHGTLLLSRLPVLSIALLEDTPTAKRTPIAEIDWGGRRLRVAVLHLSSDLADEAPVKRARQMAALLEHLAEPSDAFADLVLGDFNSDDPAPAGSSFLDAWTAAHPHEPGFTYDPKANRLAAEVSRSSLARRLDRVLLRPKELLSVGEMRLVGTEAASDHFGLRCTLAAREHSLADAAPVHTSALVLLPPPEAWPAIQDIRRVHDRHFERWMPHVNLLYGFVAEAQLPEAAERVARIVRGIEPFEVSLKDFGTFDHRTRSTLWLRPDTRPKGALVDLQAALQQAFPRCDEQSKVGERFTPHLSLGQFPDSPTAVAASRSFHFEPLRFQARELCLISRRGDEPFEVGYRVPLGPPPALRLFDRIDQIVASLGARAHLVGSYRLGIASASSDLDLVVVGPEAVRPLLQEALPGSRLADDALHPVLKADLEGVHVDVAFATDDGTVPQAVRDSDELLRVGASVVGEDLFRAVARAVRSWASMRDLRSNAYGLFGGISWNVLAAWACAHAPPTARTTAKILDFFFESFGRWDWSKPVALSAQAAKSEARGRMCILTPTAPFANSARNVTASTFDLLREELRARPRAPATRDRSAGLVRLEIEAGTPEARERAQGWLSAHVLTLVLELERWHRVRPYPTHSALGLDSALTDGARAACESFVASFARWPGRPPGVNLRLETP